MDLRSEPSFVHYVTQTDWPCGARRTAIPLKEMIGRPPRTIERAYELARSGEYASVLDIKKRLKAEQCESVDAQLSGRAIVSELRALLTAARKRGA